ncbi:MAG: sigma-70 family RNA polymerase sigma factor [Acidobacteria bacterium]|nr:sigma-70 family RNA polymerase sigma factor [Acidobacteriota bacterium]
MASIGLPLTAEPPLLPHPPSFQDIYQQHSATVFRTALRVTGNAADAEDVLQTVFMRFMQQNLAAIEGGQTEHYLRRAATNAAIDIIRKRQSHKESDLADAPVPAAPATDAVQKERVRRALAKLDPEDAQLFVLRNLDGYSYDELAAMFRIERGTVASRLHRIRLDLLKIVNR